MVMHLIGLLIDVCFLATCDMYMYIKVLQCHVSIILPRVSTCSQMH